MANRLSQILEHWYPQRDQCEWVLGTIYKTEGPCYRKAGSMMLFSSLGQRFGMLSGGCLESDIQRHARKVMQTGEPVCLCYDDSDEDELSFALGIGCGGSVHIMLHPVSVENQYQQLDLLLMRIRQRRPGRYLQPLPDSPDGLARFEALSGFDDLRHGQLIRDTEGRRWLQSLIEPDPHLLVIGGGIDARPVIRLADQLGWTTSIWDPRPANARREHFMEVGNILNLQVDKLPGYIKSQQVDAAVIMSHNLELDAAALSAVNNSGLRYLALLGPPNRQRRVLEQANLLGKELVPVLSGPAGLDIGGDLPESIALSILSECHAVLHKKLSVAPLREGLAA